MIGKARGCTGPTDLPVPCQPSNVFTGSNLDHRLILERTESVVWLIAFFIQKGPFGEYCISRQNVCDRWVNLPANLKPLSMNGLRFLSTQNRVIAPATCLLGRRANLLHRLGTMAGARDPAPQRRYRFLVSTGSTERTSVSDIAGGVVQICTTWSAPWDRLERREKPDLRSPRNIQVRVRVSRRIRNNTRPSSISCNRSQMMPTYVFHWHCVELEIFPNL